MYFHRDLADELKEFSKFPVVGVFGPRQSGKTTLVRKFFETYKYFNFEDPHTREFARENPREFLAQSANKNGIILDEFQHVPQILSYIQVESDENERPGYFVLTGSQNFLMNQSVTQSLAGRIGILTLLPMSFNELQKSLLLSSQVNELILKGGYPRLYAENFTPNRLFPSYIQSYVERDVRQIINVENLSLFQKFMQLCAGRIGQLLNISSLATECGISQNTIKKWLSLMEASYIIFLLQPYHVNFNKRVTKSPKLFFYDTGLACSLLRISSPEEVFVNPLRGGLFENLILSDICKQYFNRGERPPVYFWRDLNGRVEIDCLIDWAGVLTPVEIKSGDALNKRYFENLKKWKEIAGKKTCDGFVVFAGKNEFRYKEGTLLGWQKAGGLVSGLTS